MRKYGYLVVEGPHDEQFVYRLLSPFGVKRIKYKQELDAFFYDLIPESYPLEDGDIQKRMPIPVFLQNETHTIAIHSATGDSQLVDWLEENTAILGISNIVGLGVLLDTDSKDSASQRYAQITQELARKLPKINAHTIGTVSKGRPNFGVFVLPDNVNQGTLENLLLECAQKVYPDLLTMAEQYVSDVSNLSFSKEDAKDFKKPAGKNKAIIGAMANIMRPGKAVQNSIKDNRWLRDKALDIPRIKTVQDFLKELFEF